MEVPDLCIPNTINPGRYDDGIVATCTADVVVFDDDDDDDDDDF